MGLINLIASLFSDAASETPTDVADRLARVADRFDHAGNAAAAEAARVAAGEAGLAPSANVARRIEANFLQTFGLGPDGRPLKPILGRGPNETNYVRFGTTLRSGGSRAWRYHNPGYVRCGPRSAMYGAIGCDGEYAIFPNYSTGVGALQQCLRDEYPDQTIGGALRQHLPPEANSNPDRVCEDAGLDPDDKVADLTDENCRAIGPALEQQPGWSSGEEFGRGEEGCPSWIDSAWDSSGEAHSDNPDAASDVGGTSKDSVTDDS